ncbi:MAG TPA: diguanylate cyclase [Acidimicrobiales bacterium]|nr:diguanylate cyclase [Acidimicrobiales bacterium]
MSETAESTNGLAWIPAAALRLRNGVVVEVNRAAQDVLGPPEQVLARFDPADRTRLRALAEAAGRPGAEPGGPVMFRLGQEAPHRFVELELGPHPGGGAIAVAHDVTERERLDAVIAEFATGVYITDADLEATWIPRRVSESAGLPRDQFVGSDVYSMLHPDDVAPTRALVARARETPGVRCSRPLRVHQIGQPDVWWPIIVHVVWRGDDPAIGGLLVRFDMDLTAGVHLQGSDATAQALVTLGSSSITGALHISKSGALLQRSTRVREILRPVGEDGDLRWLDLLRPEHVDAVTERLAAARADSPLPAVEVAFAGNGAEVLARVEVVPYRDVQGHVAGMFASVTDLSAEREARDELAAAREELWHLANHDALTGLANRYQLADRLAAAIPGTGAADGAAPVLPGLIVADLDRFKAVNDGHGHRIGDAVLMEAARRIAAAVRPADLACRFGGDEFVVLCEQIASPGELDAIADQIVARFREPFDIEGVVFSIGVSVGGALAVPDDADDPEDLILRADRAMYAAKARRRRAPSGES